ncbi:type I-E CRISPR-associated protein Cas6/Cse3/CasE [Streptomyces sp. SID1328]|uniref:type I-E CRISPR-associated protein Cas6/Cse3/CasE n=1 Tax=Streptomyces sp. SID1328 TaxID=2690250 RepID=UPI00136A9D4F|nr:type I-E CRISPR-associated protein Cas6/Cse3/CasE [Streptomyces sp. SID1328]MYV38411.1 type I-E CRISPR-associated protein Cas6/Cse3/CasE [Streptomyces sp. SID1328]
MTTPTAPTTDTAWLTQLRLNTRNRAVLTDLSDANAMHRTLMRLLPDGLGETPRAQGRLLYRVEETDTGITVLVQTGTRPLTNRIDPNYAHTVTKDLSPLLERLTVGRPVQYRIAANPVVQYGTLTDRKKAQERLGLDRLPPARRVLSGNAADDWWYVRAARSGLDVRTIVRNSNTSNDVTRPSGTGRTRHRHAITVFEGDATITDPEALHAVILTGIGRARAFGAGLLSLAFA